MAKELKFNTEAQEAILKGASIVADAVSSTLGPRGNNVAIWRKWGSPLVVQDGVTVAKSIDLSNRFEDIGAQIIKDAASKTNDAAGDGTTTATILTEAIALEARKNVVAGSSSMILRRGIEKAVEALVEELDRISTNITSPEAIRQVALIAAQNEEIGDIVSTAVNRMGKDGVIAVEESPTTQISIEYKEGMEFNKGYLSPLFVTDQTLMEAVMNKPYILITDKRLDDVIDVINFLNEFFKDEDKDSKDLVIICSEVSPQVLEIILLNRIKNGLPILLVPAPSHGDIRKDLLKDIAVVTNGNFISSDLGMKLASVTLKDLGRADRVTSSKDSTIIVNGSGTKAKVEERVMALRNSFEKSEVNFDREKLQERIAKLTSGIAVINVGAPSEAEMRERKERIIDAISATKAAMDEGIVPGGETALLRASIALDKLVEPMVYIQGGTNNWQKINTRLNREELTGIEIVRTAIEKPFRRLMENSGYDSGRMLAKFESYLGKKNYGIDVLDGQVKDLVKAGIIDPVKVTKSALRNAASSAIMLMTTETLIVDEPEKDTNEIPTFNA